MTRFLSSIVIVAGLTALLSSSPARATAEEIARSPIVEPAPVTGEIVSVKSDQLILKVPGGEMTFRVDAKTMILLNRAEARLEDLKPGHLAVITAKRQKGHLVAKLIRARLRM